jgi:choline dehydrogenase-like flavoprotein
MMRWLNKTVHGEPVQGIDRLLGEIRTGHFERTLSVLTAAGGSAVMTITRAAHLVGGARMATRAKDGVVVANQKVFGVDNLYLADGSVPPTQGSAKPALTIMAPAARLGNHLASGDHICGQRR